MANPLDDELKANEPEASELHSFRLSQLLLCLDRCLHICRSLAANPQLRRVPVILLLPNEQSEISEEAWPVGVVRTIGKPIVLAELVELVERYAKRRPAVDRKPDLVSH